MSESPLVRLLPAHTFPVRMRLCDEATGELLWERVITLDEASGLAKVQVPGLGGKSEGKGRTVRTEVTDGTGHVTILASDGTSSDSYDSGWPPS